MAGRDPVGHGGPAEAARFWRVSGKGRCWPSARRWPAGKGNNQFQPNVPGRLLAAQPSSPGSRAMCAVYWLALRPVRA